MSGRSAGVPLRFALTVPPVESGVEEAQHEALKRLRSLALSDDQQFALEFCIHEALLNALIHGVREGGGSCITLDVEVDDKRVRVSVKDDGVGFRWALPGMADGHAHDKADSTGLGLTLIRRLMTRVRFTTFNNGIIMELNRERRGRTTRKAGPAGSSFVPGAPIREEKGSRTPVGPASSALTRDAYAC
jgi:serine/threonine-protein kinase RsbW